MIEADSFTHQENYNQNLGVPVIRKTENILTYQGGDINNNINYNQQRLLREKNIQERSEAERSRTQERPPDRVNPKSNNVPIGHSSRSEKESFEMKDHERASGQDVSIYNEEKMQGSKNRSKTQEKYIQREGNGYWLNENTRE